MGIFDTLLGKDAARASEGAAADTYSKQQQAVARLLGYGDEYAGAFQNLSQEFSPYADAGKSAVTRLLAGLGLGGNADEFTAAYRALPGYQAGLESGSNAITGNAAAKGMLNSGATLKGLQRFGSDYEDQRAGGYLDRLLGLSGMGQQATGQRVSTVGQGLQGQLGTRQSAYQGMLQSAPTIGQGQVAGANAKSSALGNLLSGGFYLGGQALGGGFGTALGKKLFA